MAVLNPSGHQEPQQSSFVMNFSAETEWTRDAVADKLSGELLREVSKSQGYHKNRWKKRGKKAKRGHDIELAIPEKVEDSVQEASEELNCESLSFTSHTCAEKSSHTECDSFEKKAIDSQVQTGSEKSNRLAIDKQPQGTNKRKKSNHIVKFRQGKTGENNPGHNISHRNRRKTMDLKKIQELLSLKTDSFPNENPVRASSLRNRMMEHLRASRFRFLNETLYTNESSESRKLFREDPDAFKAYHIGYQQQVEQWPLNPLEVIINAVRKMSKEYIIADFGCGEAKLADSVEQKVYSFDLVAMNNSVTACDMAHTPLTTSSVNVVVFCLSLMGSNLQDYLLEANRVLSQNGILKIADIESRFDSIGEFIQLLEKFGFKNYWKDLSHELFYFMDFNKVESISRRSNNLPQLLLKSCLYKKR